MAITASDILVRLSVLTGSAGNSTAGTAAGALGKYVSTTDVSGTPLNNLFDDISGAENAASEAEYRCVFVLNNHATLDMQNAVVYVSAETAGGAGVSIGVDTTAISAKGAAGAQAVQVANEDTAPAGVTFSAPTTVGTGLALGTIPAGSVKAVWVKRLAANTAALDNDGFTLGIGCDTAA